MPQADNQMAGHGDTPLPEVDAQASEGADISSLFADESPPLPQIHSAALLPGVVVNIAVLPKSHQHTVHATGLMLWEASLGLARLILSGRLPAAGRRILELGAGSSALPALAGAVAGASRYLATDGHPSVLGQLRSNLERNAAAVPAVASVVDTRLLRWGGDIADGLLAGRGDGGGSWDILVGADVVYVPEALPALLGTAARLLPDPPPPACPVHMHSEVAPPRAGSGGALEDPSALTIGALGPELVLIHMPNRGGLCESHLLDVAEKAGLTPAAPPALLADYLGPEPELASATDAQLLIASAATGPVAAQGAERGSQDSILNSLAVAAQPLLRIVRLRRQPLHPDVAEAAAATACSCSS